MFKQLHQVTVIEVTVLGQLLPTNLFVSIGTYPNADGVKFFLTRSLMS